MGDARDPEGGVQLTRGASRGSAGPRVLWEGRVKCAEQGVAHEGSKIAGGIVAVVRVGVKRVSLCSRQAGRRMKIL